MNKTSLPALLVVTASLFAGCLDLDKELDPNIDIEVQTAEAVPGSCIYGDDSTCHTFTVKVTNNNGREDANMNMFYWEARGDSGGVYDPSKVTEGPDAFAPGTQGTVRLHFDISNTDNPDDRINTIHYKALWMSEPIAVNVPAYGTESSGRGDP